MALVNLTWSETRTFTKEFEIDGYDPDGLIEEQVEEQVLMLPEEQKDEACTGVSDRDYLDWTVVREGDKTPEIKAAKPAYAEDF